MPTHQPRHLLCAAPDCAPPGRHHPTCPTTTPAAAPTGGNCRGCQPRHAHDGLRICLYHRDRLRRDALALPDLWRDLGTALSRAGTGHGERVTGTPTRGLVLNEAASDARAHLRDVLAAWCQLVTDERGLTAPPADPPAMAAHIAAHTDWLAAHPAAGDACDELHDLATGRARAIAYPSGNRVFQVAPCPMTDLDRTGAPTTQPCPGTIWTLIRPTSDYLPSELTCNQWPDHHHWDSTVWLRRLAPMLLARSIPTPGRAAANGAV